MMIKLLLLGWCNNWAKFWHSKVDVEWWKVLWMGIVELKMCSIFSMWEKSSLIDNSVSTFLCLFHYLVRWIILKCPLMTTLFAHSFFISWNPRMLPSWKFQYICLLIGYFNYILLNWYHWKYIPSLLEKKMTKLF